MASYTDTLTGLANRRYLINFRASRRTQGRLGLAVMSSTSIR